MEWKPDKWIAVFLNLFICPLGMLYLARPRWALFYFLSVLLFIAVFISQPIKLNLIWITLIVLAATLHGYLLASRGAPVPRRPRYSRWQGLLLIYVSYLLLVYSFRAFIYGVYTMPSVSMHPSLLPGAIVIVSKWGQGNYSAFGLPAIRTTPTKTINRGDMIVFSYPRDPSIDFIKRVVGIPGDHIAYYNKTLYINGVPALTTLVNEEQEFDIYQETIDDNTHLISHIPAQASNLEGEATVPAEQYYVLGDNRENSSDSRVWGFVPRENIVGKVIKVIH